MSIEIKNNRKELQMSSIVFIIICVIVCFILQIVFEEYVKEKADLKFFLFWMCVCVALCFIFTIGAGIYAFLAFCFVCGADADDAPKKSSGTTVRSNRFSENKIYKNGTRRVSNISKTGYYYSDGTESWNGMLGEEHRSNGETVCDNAYIPGRRNIYDRNGKYIGYEYEDSLGITHRVEV